MTRSIKRSTSITQDKDKPCSPCSRWRARQGASNGQYDIGVEQLAKTSKFGGTLQLVDHPSYHPRRKSDVSGLATRPFDVDVKAGDSLQSIRKRINNDADNFGLSINVHRIPPMAKSKPDG